MALDRDAYFTPIQDCEKIIKTALNDHLELKHLKWVEPSAGSGNFVKAARLNGINNIEAYDIHPLGDGIIQRDFLEEETDLTGTFVFGNPPYGRRNRLTLDFIDRSFAQGAEYVGFLLSGSFTSYSTLKRIKASCEVISIRKYFIKFVNENNQIITPCLPSLFDSIFIILKKSDKKIKDMKFKKLYNPSNNKEEFDFSCGNKRFYIFDETPELGMIVPRGDFVITDKSIKRASTLKLYLNKNFDENLIKYLSRFFKHGKPTINTLNFYSTYKHILKDLEK